MGKRVLVITDKIDGYWLGKMAEGDSYDLLTLGFNGEVFRHVNREKIGRVKVINIGEYADKAQEKVRKYIPRFIYEFPRRELGNGKTIIKYFSYGKINFWWFNKMSEKGGWGTPLINRIYHLELVDRISSLNTYQELWVEVNDPAFVKLLRDNQKIFGTVKVVAGSKARRINKSVKYLLRVMWNIFGQQINIFMRRFILGLRRAKTQVEDRAIMLFTLFPYFWSKPSGPKRTELFYRSLFGRIKEKHEVYYLAWLTTPWLAFWGESKNLAEQMRAGNIIVLELYLKPLDFLRILFASLIYLKKIVVFHLSWRNKIREYYGKYDITSIVLDEYDYFLVAPEIILSLSIAYAADSFLSGNRAACIIYRNEFQPHERGLLYGARKHCLTIGFQHQAIAKNHLQYVFLPEEIKHYYDNRESPESLPLPDKHLVAGEYPFKVLTAGGFPGADIDICGPVRYAKMVECIKTILPKYDLRLKHQFNNDDNIFLIAAPVVKADAINFAVGLAQAVKGKPKNNMLFLVKSHPVTKYDTLISDIVTGLNPSLSLRFLPDNIDLNDFIGISDAVILTGSTVGLEAICLGTLPILFENHHSFSLNPLLEIDDSYLTVTDEKELASAIDLVVKHKHEMQAIKDQWPDAIRKMFYDVNTDPEERFMQLLGKYGVIKQ
ncbi:MAG: hypothetical protein WC645_03505 [Candidatus Margulisiibacteriota bacterium]